MTRRPAKTLHEQRELLREVFAGVPEDLSLAGAVQEGCRTELVERTEVLDALKEKA